MRLRLVNYNFILRITMIPSKYDELLALLVGAEEDLYKFYLDNNKAAGKRVVRVFRELRDKSEEMKKLIQERKKII